MRAENASRTRGGALFRMESRAAGADSERKKSPSPVPEPEKNIDSGRKKHRFRPIKTGLFEKFKNFFKKGVDENGESAYSVQHLNGLCRESGR